MTAGTMEIELLDIDLDAECPCAFYHKDGTACLNPAAYRVTGRCPDHGKRGPAMACVGCTESLKRGLVTCAKRDTCQIILEYTGAMKL
jgi:hypothetical protein